MEVTNPRILYGAERTKFVTTVMKSTFNPANTDAEAEQISSMVSTKCKLLMD